MPRFVGYKCSGKDNVWRALNCAWHLVILVLLLFSLREVEDPEGRALYSEECGVFGSWVMSSACPVRPLPQLFISPRKEGRRLALLSRDTWPPNHLEVSPSWPCLTWNVTKWADHLLTSLQNSVKGVRISPANFTGILLPGEWPQMNCNVKALPFLRVRG